MAKTIKDVLKLVSNQANIQELEITASDLNEVEISDEDWGKIETGIKGLLTVESATHNKEVIDTVTEEQRPKIQEATLHSVEKRLAKIASKTGVDLDGKKKAHEQLDIIEAELPGKIGTGDNQKLIDSLKEDNDNLTQQIDALKTEHETQVTELRAGFESKELRAAFDKILNAGQWADHYQGKVQEALVNDFWNDLNSKAVLKIENGEIVPYQKDIPEKRYMIDNKKADFVKDIVEPFREPYLQKSPGPPDPKTKKQTQEKDRENMTPAEKRRADMAAISN